MLWNMRINFFTIKKTKCWLSMNIYCQISLRWTDWLLEDTVGCQALHTSLWCWLFWDFLSTARLHFSRILLSVTRARQWFLYQLDINYIVLHENFQEEVYVLQPFVYEVHGRRTKSANSKKIIYDLKQSSRAFVDKLVLLLHTMNWTELIWSLYICKSFFCQHYYFCSLYW